MLKNAEQKQFKFDFHVQKNKLYLASNPYPIRKTWKVNTKAERILVTRIVSQMKESYQGERFSTRTYFPAMSMILANVLNAYNHKAQVLVSRDNTQVTELTSNPLKITNKIIKRCCNFLHDELFINLTVGPANKYQKIQSWIEGTLKLHNLLVKHQAYIELIRNAPLIELRDEDKNPKKLPSSRASILEINRLKKPVELFNNLWLGHSLTLDGMPIMSFIRRVFNEELYYGGRFYGDYQTLEKSSRSRLMIDGDETTELDYKSIHFNILYSWKGLRFFNPDPYQVDDYDRSIIKTVALTLLNSESRSAFKRNVTKSGNPKIKEIEQVYRARLSKNYHLGISDSLKPEVLKGFISGLPDHIKGADLFNAICEAHQPICDFFGRKKIGLKLQFTDSQIMAKVINKLISQDIPIIPIHDSIVCKTKDKALVKEVMEHYYFEEMNFKITVEEK